MINIEISAGGSSKSKPAQYAIKLSHGNNVKGVRISAKEKHTANESYLFAAIKAFGMIKKPNMKVKINTASAYLKNCINGCGGSANSELRKTLNIQMARFQSIQIAE